MQHLKRGMMILLCFTLVLSAFATLPVSTQSVLAATEGISLTNASFEDPVKNGIIPGWTSVFADTSEDFYYEVTDSQSATGSYSLKISDALRNQSVALLSDPIQVIPGDTYIGTAQMYLEADSQASLSLRFYDENDQQILGRETHNNTSNGFPVQQWHPSTTPEGLAPDNAKTARLLVYTTSYSIATAYYDDVQILHEPIVSPQPAQIELMTPAVVTPNQEFSMTLRASDVQDVTSVTANVYFDNQYVQYVSMTPLGDFDSGSATVTEDVYSHQWITVSATVDGGTGINSDSEIAELRFTTVGNEGATSVRLDKDVLINGTAYSLQDQLSSIRIQEDSDFESALENGGFEEPVTDGSIPGWSSVFAETGAQYLYEVTNAQSKSGSNSLKITDALRDKSVAVLSDPIPVTPGDQYTGLAQLRLEADSAASLSLRFYDEQGNQIIGNERHFETSKGFPVNQWQAAATPDAVAPDLAVTARLLAFTTSYAVAVAHYDEMNIAHVPSAPPVDPTEEMPLVNPGFEDTVIEGGIPGWSSFFAETGSEFYYEVTDEQSASGNNSLKIVDARRDQTVALISDALEATPGEFYTGTGKLLVEDPSTASFTLRFYDENNNQIALDNTYSHYYTSEGFPVLEWTDISTPMIAAPEGTKYIRLLAYTTSYSTAVAYYDDLAIMHEIPEEPVDPGNIALVNPGYEEPVVEDSIPGWSSVFATTGEDYYYEVTDTQQAAGQYSLKIVDSLRDQSVALLSDPLPVVPGDFYTGTGQMMLEDGSTGSFALRFYDQNMTQLEAGTAHTHYETSKGYPVNTWDSITTPKVTAPAQAKYVRLLVYTTSYSIAVAYFDELTIEYEEDVTPAQLKITAPPTLTMGEEFSVSLTASDVKTLNRLNGVLFYDTNLLEFKGVTAAGPFAGEGASVSAQHQPGQVNILADLGAGHTITEASDIASLQFSVIGDSGQAWIVLGKETTMNDIHHLPYDQTVLSLVGSAGEGKLSDMIYGDPELVGHPVADTIGLFDGRAGVEDGHDVMYTTVKGIPPVFHVVDMDDYKLLRSIPLEGGGDVWSHTVAPDGTVYIAAGGQLWAYSPETKQAQMVFTYPGESVFWALDHDEEGKVYIASGPGGKILQYDPETQQGRDYGRLMGHVSQEYVRSIAYSDGFVYGGTSLAEIYKVDVETGEKVEIASSLDEEGYVYDLDIVDNKLLIARFSTPQKRYIYNLETEEWLDLVMENSSSGLHLPKESLNGKVYLPVNGKIMEFDVNTYEYKESGMEYNTGFRGADWVEVDDPDLPGPSIATMNFFGGIYFFNPQTKTVKGYESLLPPSPSITHKFKTGMDGKIYITAMQASSASEFDVFTQEFKLFGMGQAGSITPYEDKVYFGNYPGAYFKVYDPREELSDQNPKEIFRVGEAQDRPIHGTVGDDGKIYLGSIPDYGELGGALTVFDPSAPNPQESLQVYRNIVQDQSIISLAYKDGKVYGSTNINGGLSSQTVAKEAKMFVWDVEKAEKLTEFTLDIPGLVSPTSIGGLSIGPDGLLWGGVNGIVFAMDPETLKLIKYKNLFPSDSGWGQWGSFEYQWADDLLYMHLGRRLVVIDPITLDFKHFGNSEAFAIGADGHLYFAPHSDNPMPGANRTLMYRIDVRDVNHPGKLHIQAPLRVEEGKEFEVGLYASQAVDLHAIEAVVSYDPNQLELMSVAEAAEFHTFETDSTGGSIQITAQLAEETGWNDDAKVAVLRFKTITATASTAVVLNKESSVAFSTRDTTYAMEKDESIAIRVTAADHAAPATLLLDAPAFAAKDQTFTATLDYTDAADWYAAQIQLSYDPAKLELVGITGGEAFSSEQDGFFQTSTDTSTGSIEMIASKLGDQVITGDGMLASLTFKVLADHGSTSIVLEKTSELASSNSDETGEMYALPEDVEALIDITFAPEDVNADGKVNLVDLVAVAKKLQTPVTEDTARLDVNRDGQIDISDLSLITHHIFQ